MEWQLVICHPPADIKKFSTQCTFNYAFITGWPSSLSWTHPTKHRTGSGGDATGTDRKVDEQPSQLTGTVCRSRHVHILLIMDMLADISANHHTQTQTLLQPLIPFIFPLHRSPKKKENRRKTWLERIRQLGNQCSVPEVLRKEGAVAVVSGWKRGLVLF